MTTAYDGSTKKRFGSFVRSAPIQPLKRVPLIETEASHFLNALRHPRAGSSTNKWMRIVHNRALDLGWLLAPVLARKVWPAFRTKKGIAITLEQHRRLVDAEQDEEFTRYLEVLSGLDLAYSPQYAMKPAPTMTARFAVSTAP
jgi:hypothetical protein